MDKATWTTVKTLFEHSVGLAENERSGFLHDCAPSLAVRTLVENMLKADASTSQTIRPALHQVEEFADRIDDDLVGQSFGPYLIDRIIGRGGMGTVYRARRESDGVAQQVALKVIRQARLAPATRQRFQQERRILAGLDHPNIARLIDFGTVDQQAYYAMEYVDNAVAITDYCDTHGLSIGARVRLFQHVCSAVAHAHRNLVVHRDIKPSNVLVNDEGQVKLVDFGIAKPLQSSSAMEETATSNRFMSPYCAAPEMVLGQMVTTASDVYALGVLLYELISGHKPYDLAGLSPGEIERAIVEVIPARASARVLTAADHTKARVRACRSAAVLSSKLKGDLDTIVLRALAKEPQRRYPSAEALNEDLKRQQRGLPVHARPDRLAYRVSKFYQRHRVGTSLGALFALSLMAASIGLWLQWQQALSQQARAEQVSRFLIDTFRQADPSQALGEEITARQILDHGVGRLKQDLKGDPKVRSDLLYTMAEAYSGLGLYEPAEGLASEALELRHGQPTASVSLRQMARIAIARGQTQTALTLLEQAQQLEPDEPANWFLLATVWTNLGEPDRAEALLRHALASLRQTDPHSFQTALALRHLATRLRSEGAYDQARELYLEALHIYRADAATMDPHIADALSGLSVLERRAGNLEKARDLALESLEIYRAVYGETHPTVGQAWGTLGNLYYSLEAGEEAANALEKGLGLVAQFDGPYSRRTAMSHYNLGRVYNTALNDLPAAETHFRAAYDISLALRNDKNVDFYRLGLGTVLSELGRWDEAEALLRTSLDSLKQRSSPDGLSVAYAESALAEVLLHQCKPQRAQTMLEHALAIFDQKLQHANGAESIAQERLQRAQQMQLSGCDKP